jgi:uncharacterized protein (TIGR03083 family)
MDRDETWRIIADQRRGLADLLEPLTPRDWDGPSLCEGWRIRDVAAHLTLPATTGMLASTVEIVRARGSFHRMVHDTAVRKGSRPVETLVADLRTTADSRRLPPGTDYRNTLLDVLVHGQDIAVPLGIGRPMPLDAAGAAADRIWAMGWPFHARRRVGGFRLDATDIAWTRGDGPLVAGPIEALLLLLAGRRASLPRLVGEGAAVLTERQAPRSAG